MSFIEDHLSFLIVGQTDGIELLDNFLRGAVLLDPAFGVEAHHVAGVDLSGEFEEFSETLLLRLCEPAGGHGDHEVDVSVVMVFFVVLRISVSKSCVNSAHKLP